MARVKANSILEALQGSIGKELVFKQYADKVVITQYPDMSNVKPSTRQKEQREKMKEANAYARTVLSNPELKAVYEQNLQKGESVYRKAIKEYFARLKGKQ